MSQDDPTASMILTDAEVERLVRDLGSWRAPVAREAADQLVALGPPALAAIIDALESVWDLELDGRAEQVLIRIGKPSIGPLVNELHNGNSSIQFVALNVLAALGGPQSRSALKALAISACADVNATRKSSRRRALLRGIVVALTCYFGWMFLIAGPEWFLMWFVIWVVLMRTTFRIFDDRSRYARSGAAKALFKANGKDLISFWAGRLDDTDSDIRHLAEMALISLLPDVSASDAPFVLPNAQEALVAALRRPDRELRLAILNAMEQIGDHRAIPSVRALAQLARDPQIRTAAEICLTGLLARAAHTLPADMLLRPADGPNSDGLLLRPAGKSTSQDAQLLRPTG